MKQNEIIKLMIQKGIISVIGDDYFLTEKYKEVLLPVVPKLDMTNPKEYTQVTKYDELLDSSTNGSNWPSEVLDSTGRSRAVALMNCCEIPTTSSKGYRLRGIDKEGINIVGNLVDSKDIHPNTFIEAIKLYYKYTDMPKAFKNLLADGDILDIYNEHIEGKLKSNLIDKPIENKGTWQ